MRLALWLAPLALLLPAVAMALKLDVRIEGVEGAQRKNVEALLGIWQQRKDADLTVPQLLALHREAPEQIRNALSPFGLYRVQVEDALDQPASDGGTWVATYRIDPGVPVKIAGIDYVITGAGEYNPSFPKQFPMQVGEVLYHPAYEKAKAEILSIASEEGYIDAELTTHQVLVDLVTYQAFVDFKLDTGTRWYLGDVTFKQDLLDDDFVQRYVNFKPGAIYDSDLLLGLQSRLLATEYFDQVEIVPKKGEAGADHVIPIEVIAHRNKANKYRVGVGYGTDVGPRFNLDYTRRYIGRRGHKFKTEIQVSQPIQSFVAEYRIPIRNPVQDYIQIRPEFYSYDTANRQGDLLRVGAAQSVLTPGGWRRNLGMDYRYEDYEVGDDGSGNFNGLVPYASWSKVVADDPINTRNGHRLKYLLQGTVENVLSETTWVSGTVNYKVIKSFGPNTRFIARTDLGITGADNIQAVPASDRFFAGGDTSIRGWGFDVLGPIDPDTGATVGGRYLAVGSVEVERRIKGNWGGVLFTDFGNAFDPEYPLVWEQGAGVGIRYATPIGPVRLDLAYALTKPDGGFRLHFGLGPDL